MPGSVGAECFRMLGRLEIDGVDDRQLGGPKQRALLALLLLHANEVVSTERIVEAVWGADPPATATAIVHGYMRRLREALADSPAELITRAPGYMVSVDLDRLDARVFKRLAREGRELLGDDAASARVRLDAALSLWRGEALAGLPDEGFVAEERRRLDALRHETSLDRIDAELLVGGSLLVPELEAVVQDHPFQERPRRQLMLALYRAGRQADALALYRDTRRLFAEELGLEPSRELQELEQAILRHDDALRQRPGAPSSPAVRRRRTHRWWLVGAAALAAIGAAVGFQLSAGGHHRLQRARPARILATFDVAQPSCCGFGFGAAWAAGHHDDTLREIDPQTNRIINQLKAVGFQSGVPRAAAGSVWIPAAGGDLVRFDPVKHSDTARIPISGPSVAFGFLTMWETTTDHHLDRIDIASNKITRTIRLADGANNWVDELGIGEGAVWVAVADNATLDRIDPATNKITAEITGFEHTDSGMPIAVDQNAVWVLRFVGGQETLFRVDPTRNAIVARIAVGPSNGAAPSGTLTAADGYVWTGNWDNTISKVDERTNRVIARLRLPDAPQNLTYGFGSLWVDSYDASKVWRIDPNS